MSSPVTPAHGGRPPRPRPAWAHETGYVFTNLIVDAATETEAVALCYLMLLGTRDMRSVLEATGIYRFALRRDDGTTDQPADGRLRRALLEAARGVHARGGASPVRRARPGRVDRMTKDRFGVRRDLTGRACYA
jgi:hypothetical protein